MKGNLKVLIGIDVDIETSLDKKRFEMTHPDHNFILNRFHFSSETFKLYKSQIQMGTKQDLDFELSVLSQKE